MTPRFAVLVLVLAVTAIAAGSPAATESAPDPLPGAAPLEWPEQAHADMADRLMDGAHRFVEGKLAAARDKRETFWSRDLANGPEAYEVSVAPSRERLREILGVVDERLPAAMERFGAGDAPGVVAEHDGYTIWQARWPVLEGVWGEGLLAVPHSEPAGYAVALPDADQTPEDVMGLTAALDPARQMGRRLAERGFLIAVPVLADRRPLDPEAVGVPPEAVGRTEQSDQTHREWLYRQAFHMGRHVIGYEIQIVLAAAAWLRAEAGPGAQVGVAGYGEGGLIALHAAAVGTELGAALVSGYFDSREALWTEPIYRNIWGFTRTFGDAELASLIAPRPLVIEHSPGPEVTGHKGDLTSPEFAGVSAEFGRIATLVPPDFPEPILVHGGNGESTGPGSTEALNAFAEGLGVDAPAFGATAALDTPLADRREAFDPAERHLRHVLGIQGHVQQLVRRSHRVRETFFTHEILPELADTTWSTEPEHPTLPHEPFAEASAWYRTYFREVAMGEFQTERLPLNPRTRKTHDTPHWTGHDVVLDVFEDLVAWGVLLVPRDIEPGTRRPVVVTQHGRNGLPEGLIDGDRPAYGNVAAELAERGFVVFVPHNLYRGEDRYRWLDRKANALGASLFSFIIPQHDQILRWLNTLDFVDGERIGFYGLSYGGRSALRVPAALEGYALSICSGDFNQWTRKVAGVDAPASFMHTIEWETFDFNLGHTFDHAEMAALIFPRPFMVERGHYDHVAQDRWTAHEYAKVRRLYAMLGLPERTAIEYFHGGHAMRREGTYAFLHEHLDWPEP